MRGSHAPKEVSEYEIAIGSIASRSKLIGNADVGKRSTVLPNVTHTFLTNLIGMILNAVQNK